MLLFSLDFWRESLGYCAPPAPSREPTEGEHRLAEQAFWRKTYALSEVALGASIAAALLAIGAVSAALYQAKLTRDTLIDGARAYVGVSGLTPYIFTVAKVQDGKEEPATWLTKPKIGNAGNTPTRDLRWISGDEANARKEWIEAGYFPGVDLHDPDGVRYRRGSAHLAAKQDSDFIAQHRIPVPPDIIAKPTRPFVFGVLMYRDFVSGDVHITRYCYGFYGFSSKANSSEVSYEIYPCGRDTNCTDEECSDDDRASAVRYLQRE